MSSVHFFTLTHQIFSLCEILIAISLGSDGADDESLHLSAGVNGDTSVVVSPLVWLRVSQEHD